jgi:hypothetical protein
MNVGLLFGIIFAIIVLGFVMFFGYDYISKFLGISGEASLVQQILTLEGEVKDVFNLAMGSTKEFRITIPSNVGRVCFVNPENPESNPSGGWEMNVILTKMITSYQYNVLILDREGRFDDGKKIDHLIPNQNFCISSGKRLLLKNEGKFVSISELV